MPDWAKDVPDEAPSDWYFLQAFRRLNTERLYEMGPIPYAAIVAYADRHGLDSANTEALVEVVGQMDSAFLEWNAEQLDRQRKTRQKSSPDVKSRGRGRSADDIGGRR